MNKENNEMEFSLNWKDSFPKENRYFETENGILYCGDCLEAMDELIAKGVVVDVIITDPPYIDYPKIL